MLSYWGKHGTRNCVIALKCKWPILCIMMSSIISSGCWVCIKFHAIPPVRRLSTHLKISDYTTRFDDYKYEVFLSFCRDKMKLSILVVDGFAWYLLVTAYFLPGMSHSCEIALATQLVFSAKCLWIKQFNLLDIFLRTNCVFIILRTWCLLNAEQQCS